MVVMPTSALLARLTLALASASAVGVLITACGDDANGGATGTTCLSAVPAATSPSDQTCHVDDDCPKGNLLLACYAPGQSACSGSFGDQIPPCSSDADCKNQGIGTVCQARNNEPKYCSSPCDADGGCDSSLACDVATGHCQPRSCETTACPADTWCTPAKVCAYQRCNEQRPCGEGFSCTTSFVCEPTPCTGAATGECPSTYACDPNTKACQRKTCACDGECGSGGFCVEGSCHTSLGRCQGPCAAGRPLLDGVGSAILAPLVRAAGWSPS